MNNIFKFKHLYKFFILVAFISFLYQRSIESLIEHLIFALMVFPPTVRLIRQFIVRFKIPLPNDKVLSFMFIAFLVSLAYKPKMESIYNFITSIIFGLFISIAYIHDDIKKER